MERAQEDKRRSAPQGGQPKEERSWLTETRYQLACSQEKQATADDGSKDTIESIRKHQAPSLTNCPYGKTPALKESGVASRIKSIIDPRLADHVEYKRSNSSTRCKKDRATSNISIPDLPT